MKILRSGKTGKPKSHTISCDCGCLFSCTRDDARNHVAYDRDGTAYIIKCPECKEDHWVDATLL